MRLNIQQTGRKEAADGAINALDNVPDSNYKKALIDIARLSIQRRF